MKLATISELFEVTSSKRVFKSEWKDSGVPFYRAREIVKLSRDGHVDNDLYISEDMYSDYSSKYGVPSEGDLLVTGVGTLGICYQVKANDRFYFKDGNIIWFKKKVSVSSDYIEYCFKSPFVKRQIASKADGATVGTYTITNAKTTKIPLPPLEEQKQIAAILDAADELRQKDKALITRYDELTQSIFLDMFGDPVTNPKGWEELQLENVCTKLTDGTHHSPEPQSSGYPYVTAKHVKAYNLDFNSKPTYVDETAHKEIYKRCNPEFGDVLYIKDGATTGIACINTFDEPISMLSSLALLKLKSDIISNHYLCHWLNHDGVKEKLISQFMSGAAIKRYTLKKISSFILPVPPIDIQNRYSEQVQAINDQKAIAQDSLGKSEELFNSLLQKAFIGDLTD